MEFAAGSRECGSRFPKKVNRSGFLKRSKSGGGNGTPPLSHPPAPLALTAVRRALDCHDIRSPTERAGARACRSSIARKSGRCVARAPIVNRAIGRKVSSTQGDRGAGRMCASAVLALPDQTEGSPRAPHHRRLRAQVAPPPPIRAPFPATRPTALAAGYKCCPPDFSLRTHAQKLQQ